MAKKEMPSLNAVLSNWKVSKAPPGKKIKMALKNNWLKFRRGKPCCGNHGEVGC